MPDQLKEYWQLWQKYAKAILIITAMTAFPAIFVQPSVAIGALLGGFVALLNFRLLAISVQQSVELPVDKAGVFAISRYLIRFLITLILFGVLLLRKDLGPAALIGALPPFFAIKITLFLEALIKHLSLYVDKRNNERR